MIFDSSVFLFVFLPVVLVGVFPLPRAWQNAALTALSLVFFVWGTGFSGIWVLLVAALSWTIGGLFARGHRRLPHLLLGFAALLCLAGTVVVRYVPAFRVWLRSIVGWEVGALVGLLLLASVLYLFLRGRGQRAHQGARTDHLDAEGAASVTGAAPRRGRWSTVALGIGVLLCLAPLAFFKYVPAVRTWWAPESVSDVLVPLGLSFLTFRAISYLVEVRRGLVPQGARFDHYLLYLFFFPALLAGPITRYSEMHEALVKRPRPMAADVLYGLARFGWGLAKKLLIADTLGGVVSATWSAAGSASLLPATTAWLGAIAFALQIFFDFSAYTDMAVGLGRVFGFRLPENFAAPYASWSAQEFWRRWHMTLTRWFRDYVYIPMGGNRHGRLREYTALLVTFAATALWHGATLPFLLWGGMWAMLLVLERATGLNRSRRLVPLRRVGMVLFIVISWVPFRSESLGVATTIWRSMVSGPLSAPDPVTLLSFTPFAALALALGLAYLFRSSKGSPRLFDRLTCLSGEPAEVSAWRAALVGVVALVAGVMLSAWSASSPFIYLQF